MDMSSLAVWDTAVSSETAVQSKGCRGMQLSAGAVVWCGEVSRRTSGNVTSDQGLLVKKVHWRNKMCKAHPRMLDRLDTA